MNKSLLRRLVERGDKVSLVDVDSITVSIQILTASKMDIPEDWLNKAAKIITQQARQIKENGEISHEEIKSFFDRGGKLIEELSDDEWLTQYNMVSIN